MHLGYKVVDSNTISFGIAPRINACGRMGFQEEALKLFLTNNIVEAQNITVLLNKYNSERQETEKIIFEQALKKINEEEIYKNNSIVVSGDNWHHGVIGIVASKLTEKFFKPTILICFEGEEGKGSGRSIPGFDLHEALCLTSEYLEKYGGHEMAVGLSLNKSKYNSFKNKFEEIANEKNVNELTPVIQIDAQLNLNNINIKTIKQLKVLEPFGEENKTPIFIYKNLKINSIRALGEGRHLKLTLKDGNYIINAIGFNMGHLVNDYLIDDKVNIVGMLELNLFNGQEIIQINLKDIMKSI